MQRAQGNAFYVEELVGAFLGGGWSLPEDLADLLLVRLDRLDESSRAPGAGRLRRRPAGAARPARRASPPAARTSSTPTCAPRSTPTCWCASNEAEYAFRHALLGEAVYDDLLPGERMRLHTAYAEAVRELRGQRGSRRPRPARARLPRPPDGAAGQRRRRRAGPRHRWPRRGRPALHQGAGDLRPGGRPSRRPTRAGRAGRPDGGGPVRLRSSGDGAVPGGLPPRLAGPGRPATLPGPAAARAGRGDALDRGGRPTRAGHGRGARAGRPGADATARPDPRRMHAAGLVRTTLRGGAALGATRPSSWPTSSGSRGSRPTSG